MPSETNTIFFTPKGKVPAGRTLTYGIIVAIIRPQGDETHRTLLTVGGGLIILLVMLQHLQQIS